MELNRVIGGNGKSYEFINIIGRGAFGEVWRATCKLSNEDFAIKVVNNKGLEYCQQETSIHKKLWHDSILQFYEEINNCSSKFLVLEYCPNGNLQEYIDKNSSLPEVEARLVFKKIVNGVAYLHYKNIVHRDLKPANLLLTNNMDVKIADFGQAVELKGNMQCTGLYGTVPYYSPEMLERRPYRMETDCWSLGCILYFLLAGQPPFSCSQTGNSIRKADYIILSRLSHAANNLIQSLLMRDQKRRMPAYGILHHSFMMEEKTKLATHSFDSGMHSGITSSKDSQNVRMPFRSHSIGVSTSGLGSINSSGLSSFRTNDSNGIHTRNCYRNSPPIHLSSSLQHVATNQKVIPILKENLLPNKQAIIRYSDDKRETRLKPVYGQEIDIGEERRHLQLLDEETSRRYDRCENFFRKSYNESPQHIITNQRIAPVLKENLLPNKHKAMNPCYDDKKEIYLRPIYVKEREVSEEQSHIQSQEDDRSNQHSCCEDIHFKESDIESSQDRNIHVYQHHSPCHSDLGTPNKDNFSSNHICKKCPENLSDENVCSRENMNRSNSCPLIPPNDVHLCSSIKSNHCCHGSHNSGLENHKCRYRSNCTSTKHSNHGCGSACSCSSNCCESHHQPEQNSLLASDAKNDVACHSSVEYSPRCLISPEAHDICNSNVGHKKQVSHKQSKSQFNNSQETCTSVLQNLPSPIKLARLKPQRIRLNNNMYTILKSGKLCVEVIGNNFQRKENSHRNNQENVIAVYVISENGMKIVRYKPRGIGLPLADWPLPIPSKSFSSFSYNNLPQKYWKVYHVAAKFVNFIRSATRKVTFYSEEGSFTLMENGPDADFIGRFNSGGKIKKSGDSIQITNNGNIYNVNSEDEVYSLGNEIMNMWKHFCQCHEHCRKIEVDVERNTENDIFSRFPLTIGSQKNPVRRIKTENSSPLYSLNSVGTSEASTVLTDATNLIENRCSGLRKNMIKGNQHNMKLLQEVKSNVGLKVEPKSATVLKRENVLNHHLLQNVQPCNKIVTGNSKDVHVNRVEKLNDCTVAVYSDNTKVSFSRTKPVDRIYYWICGVWKCYPVNEPRMIKELPQDLRQRLSMLGPENFRDVGVT